MAGMDEVYRPKSKDEQKFVDKHVTIKHADRNGNGDEAFNASNVKTIKRKPERHGYDSGDDEKVYENLKGDQHKIDANKNGKVDAHDFKLLRAKKSKNLDVKEETRLTEKTLTPAEMKKREEIVKAIKRSSPKMDKSMAYAIATKTAKRVAEEIEELDEISKKTLAKYIPAAAKDAERAGRHQEYYGDDADFRAGRNRQKGIERAVKRLAKEEVEGLVENAWNQLGQKKPVGNTLPAPARGSVPKHGRKFSEGDHVVPHTGPYAGQVHRVTSSRAGSVNIVRPNTPKYDSITVRAKHEHLSPATPEQAAKYKADRAEEAKKLSSTFKEEIEVIDELSKNTLRNYAQKAKSDLEDNAEDRGHFSRGHTINEALDAAARYGDHHTAIKSLLKSISQHVDTHKAEALKHMDYRGKKGVTWSHVGDLAHVHDQLANIHDHLAQQGEYKKNIGESVEEIHETYKDAPSDHRVRRAQAAWAAYPTKSNLMAYKAEKDAHKKRMDDWKKKQVSIKSESFDEEGLHDDE